MPAAPATLLALVRELEQVAKRHIWMKQQGRAVLDQADRAFDDWYRHHFPSSNERPSPP